MKKEDEKAQTEKASFFQANRKREKQRILTKESNNKTCALSNALFRRRRRRERSSFSSRNKEVLLAYARLGVLCSREREREILL